MNGATIFYLTFTYSFMISYYILDCKLMEGKETSLKILLILFAPISAAVIIINFMFNILTEEF